MPGERQLATALTAPRPPAHYLEVLPPRGRGIWQASLDKARECKALSYGLHRQAEEIRADLEVAQRRLQELQRFPRGYLNRPDANFDTERAQKQHTNATEEAQATVDSLKDTMGRVQDVQGRCARESQATLIEPGCRYFAFLRGPLRGYAGVEPAIKKGQTIETIRAEIAACDEAVEAAQNAPLPLSEVLKRVSSQIESWSEAPNYDRVFASGGGEVVLPTTMLRASNPYSPTQVSSFSETLDTIGVLAWLFKDQLIEKISTEITARADDANALTDVQRAERIGGLKREKLALERVEERLIEMSSRTLLRRRDADLRAVFWLSDTLPEPRED